VSAVVSVLYSLRFLVSSRASLHLEIVVLRHQLAAYDIMRDGRTDDELGADYFDKRRRARRPSACPATRGLRVPGHHRKSGVADYAANF